MSVQRDRLHWPEYLIEAASLGTFMVSAAAFATLFQHPASPLSAVVDHLPLRRLPMGLAMGLTAVALIYSPTGRRSGAHMNPAVTLTFLRLGTIAFVDAAGYVVAQFTGGLLGLVSAVWMLRGLPSDPSVNFVATAPGAGGTAFAFGAELVMSFVMMLTVLRLSNEAQLARFTGLAAGLLVAIYITVEAPVSGMSLNPARTLPSALLAHTLDSLWIYVTAPPLGMLLAAEVVVRIQGRARVRCAKLHHSPGACIFNCGYRSLPAEAHT